MRKKTLPPSFQQDATKKGTGKRNNRKKQPCFFGTEKENHPQKYRDPSNAPVIPSPRAPTEPPRAVQLRGEHHGLQRDRPRGDTEEDRGGRRALGGGGAIGSGHWGGPKGWSPRPVPKDTQIWKGANPREGLDSRIAKGLTDKRHGSENLAMSLEMMTIKKDQTRLIIKTNMVCRVCHASAA